MGIKKVEIEADVPEGWEAVAYRIPVMGDYHLPECGRQAGLVRATVNYASKRIIVRKLKQYRDPVLPADRGKPAEFSNDGVSWGLGWLAGWYMDGPDDDEPWVDATALGWGYCRIEVENSDGA
jgi:hypothetical protein